MSLFRYIKYCGIILLWIPITSVAQTFSFHHLNTSNGLSDNNVRCMAVDSMGFLWIGTTDGLNLYDGYSVKTFFREKEKNLASNNIVHLTTDSRNRIWIGTSQGASLIDGNRNFHRIILNDTITRFACASVLETKSFGVVLYTNLGQFYFDSTKKKWQMLEWVPASLGYHRFLDAEAFDEDKIIFCTDSMVSILDYGSRKISFEKKLELPVSACRMNDDEIAVGILSGRIEIVNMHNGNVRQDYQLTNELDGKIIHTDLTEVRRASNGSLLVATGSAGLVSIDFSGKIERFTHDPIQPGSISSNNTYRVLPASSGYVIIGTTTSGINIFNINNKQAGYIPVFSDATGRLYDNFLNEMIEGKDGNVWIGGYDRLIRWNRNTNQAHFYYHYLHNKDQGRRSLEIRALSFDHNGKLWVSALGEGLSIFNEGTGQFRKIAQDISRAPALRSPYVHDILTTFDNQVWVCTNNGFCAVNPVNFQIIEFDKEPELKSLSQKRAITLYEDSRHRIWVATPGQGIYCYDRTSKQLDNYNESDGLVSNTSYGFKEDKRGNIYAASQSGFSVISPTGKIRSYTRQNGLRYDRCESFLQDDDGNMWIANNLCLIKFDPVKGRMEYFDEKAGLSVYGFRFDCSVKTKNGELIFGGQKGINYFNPRQLVNNSSPVKVAVYEAGLKEAKLSFEELQYFKLPYKENDVQFYFTAINLEGSGNILYEYKLEGYDKVWQQGLDIRQVRYSFIPPGDYVFKVRASTDHINWINSRNEVRLTIVPPLWQRWWFIAAGVSLLAGLIYWFISNRNRKIEDQREEIETEQAINYFATSLSEQQTESDILWDVAKNCIGRLQFEDCVVYILDEEKGMLIQAAAHGPKSPRHFEINAPIEIRPGQGIVGTVALTGNPEIVEDTTKDARYIVDDELRYSEITVPIVYNGKVLGVIDCEHSKKRFFTQKHLSILTTIASLCANKLVRVRAEDDRKEAQKVLMSTQQKMNEVEMQALRAQMNPHFIFNCLNSINRYIVKSDQTTASLYLTKFARLIRLILDNSNSKNVVLANELEALKLYIEMEALRFDKKFTYEIKLEGNVSADTIELPPLIIQPYVENAIWHGLLHKEGNGHLSIRVSMQGENLLQCIIEDNGVGRKRANEFKSKTATSRKSLGMQLTESRLKLLNKHTALSASVQIIDLENEQQEAEGTIVILKIPV